MNFTPRKATRPSLAVSVSLGEEIEGFQAVQRKRDPGNKKLLRARLACSESSLVLLILRMHRHTRCATVEAETPA